jgi:hypothetical protein
MVEKFLTGGDKLMKKLEEISQKMGGGAVEIGFMENATYPNGTQVAAVAFWNEFGHMGKAPAPPRPFFRNMISKESTSWGSKMAGLAKATDYDGKRVLGMMGKDIRDALEQSIRDFTTPGLADSTIKRKGFSKPLIDTTTMVNAPDFRVVGAE